MTMTEPTLGVTSVERHHHDLVQSLSQRQVDEVISNLRRARELTLAGDQSSD